MSTRRKANLNNPALLTWARETAGYSIEEIAVTFGKPPEVIAAWERGDDCPTFSQLERFARKVKRSLAALYLPQPPSDAPLPADFRRLPSSRGGEFGPVARLAFRTLRNAVSDLADLLEETRTPISFDLPEVHIRQPAAVGAAILREALGVSMDQQIAWSSDYAALDGWRDILFDRGILVRLLSVDTAEFRGFSVLERHLAGIGISSKDAPPARIFSLFHEVAHLCLRLPGVSGDSIDIPDAASDHLAVVERYCNCFAVAFLLPDGDGKVAKALADLSASSLAPQMLRHYSRAFKVSKYVLARRMLDIGLLQPDMYWNTIDEWRNQEVSLPKGGHPDYMTAHVSQIGKRFAAFVLSAMDRGILNGHDAAGILAMRPDKLDAVRLHLA